MAQGQGGPDARQAARVRAAIADCRLCAPAFARTATAHAPRPVVWFRPGARLLIAGQAPGLRVHRAGEPFRDRSGDVLRGWTGLDEAAFYDRARVAIVPMAFCFPGYDATGADLPPPAVCARTWRAAALATLPGVRLTLLVGGAAIRWHTGARSVAAAAADWRAHLARGLFPLPHPSWRTTGWQRANPWFAAEALPALRAAVAAALAGLEPGIGPR